MQVYGSFLPSYCKKLSLIVLIALLTIGFLYFTTPMQNLPSQPLSTSPTLNITHPITLVISGPLHQYSLDCPSYYHFAEIIILYYNSDPSTALLKDCLLCTLHTTRMYSIRPIKEQSNQNSLLQFYNGVLGASFASQPYIIKVRSDACWNLTPFINQMLNNNKLTVTNIFFRPWNYCCYHISDHIIGGRTNQILNGFDNAFSLVKLKSTRYMEWMVDECIVTSDLPFPPEALLYLGYIMQFPRVHLSKAEFLSSLNLVPSMSMAPFKMRVNNFLKADFDEKTCPDYVCRDVFLNNV